MDIFVCGYYELAVIITDYILRKICKSNCYIYYRKLLSSLFFECRYIKNKNKKIYFNFTKRNYVYSN